MPSREEVLTEHEPHLRYEVYSPAGGPVELVFHGRGVFWGLTGQEYFTEDDEGATSLAANVERSVRWFGQLRVRLVDGADPHVVGQAVTDLLMAIRLLDAGVPISEPSDASSEQTPTPNPEEDPTAT